MIKLTITLICIVGIIAIKMFKYNKKINQHKYNIFKIILITLTCELTIFNINSYRTFFSNYEKKEIPINKCELKNLTYDEKNDSYIMENDNAYILIEKDLNCKVGTVYLDANIQEVEREKKALEYAIIYTDETSQNYRQLPSKYLVNSIQNSKYTTCYLSGKSKEIGIRIYGEKGTNIKIQSIKINSEVSFKFNVYRVLIIITIFMLIYSLKHLEFFNKSFEENKPVAIKIIVATMIFFVILNVEIAKNTISGEDDFYSKDFAESIINGKFYLEKEPSKELMELENPYDSTLRDRSRDGWDIALFEGKHYIYFGILPELIMFVPYMIIYHEFLPSGVGVLIFLVLIIIGLGILLLEILEKWFSKVPLKLWFYSEIILLSGSVVFNLAGRPELYEVAVSSALCFCVWGVLFAFRFFTREHPKYTYLNLACLFLALAVACRPTSLLVSLIILPPIIVQLIKNIKQKKNIIKIILSVAIPYLTIGILLMIYNYIRFKNPLEFGAKYQLTVNDMIHLKYRLMTIPAGLYTAFLKLPHFISEFPFITRDGGTINFFGFFYTEDNIGGLFMLVPTILAILFVPKVKIQNKKIEYMVKSFIIVGLIISIISMVKAGVSQRYLADYAWILIIASLIILLTIYEKFESQEAKKIFMKIIGMCVIYTFLINLFSGGIVGEKDFMKNKSPNTYYNIRYTMCFWE